MNLIQIDTTYSTSVIMAIDREKSNSRLAKLIMTLLALFFIFSGVKAENLPETYQQFKTAFVQMEVPAMADKGINLKMRRQTKIWVGVGAGVATMAVAGYFFINGQQEQYEQALLIGAGTYIPVIAVLVLTDEKRDRGPYD